MSTEDFITELFYRVDVVMHDVPKHPQSRLYPSEIVTLALLFALKGVGNRAFDRWLRRDYLPLFPKVPHHTRLFRLFAAHQHWADRFLADPTVLGVADSYGIELLHPMREGRSPQQPPIRHAVCWYGRNCLAKHVIRYHEYTPAARPEQIVARLSPCCNLVLGHRRCCDWRREAVSPDDPDEQAGYLHDRAGGCCPFVKEVHVCQHILRTENAGSMT